MLAEARRSILKANVPTSQSRTRDLVNDPIEASSPVVPPSNASMSTIFASEARNNTTEHGGDVDTTLTYMTTPTSARLEHFYKDLLSSLVTSPASYSRLKEK